MKVWRCPQFSLKKRGDRARLYGVLSPTVERLTSQGLEELKHLLRRHPAIRKEVVTVENAQANELA
jgi:hypothetical protein